MKHLPILALATAAIAIALVSCKQVAKNIEADDDQSRTLVVYYSATGTTQAVAELLAQAANADLKPILPAEVYTDDDLNWRDSLSRSSVEMRDPATRPAIDTAQLPDLAPYDTLFIGFPIWWGVAPHVVNTFIEALNLQGKTIIPFATSGGSPIEPATEALRTTYPALTILDGSLLNDITFEDLSEWVDELRQ